MRASSVLLIAGGLLLLTIGGVYVWGKTRGLRLNNPGCIREAPGDKTKWVGERATDDDPIFEEFNTPEAGIRALAVILKNYNKINGLNTIAGIISRWSPGHENNTAAYIADVCQQMNLTPDAQLNFANKNLLFGLVSAIIKHENGINPYPADLIWRGINAA